MIRNFYSIALRRLVKDKSYFAINISGLALGIASFGFIALYIIHELSYDQFHKDFQNIYRVNAISKGVASDRAVTNIPLSRALLNEYPDVAKATRVLKSGPHLIISGNNKINEEVVMFGDSTLFDVFNVQLVRGSPKNALAEPRSLILSESYAKKYFDNSDPLGQQLALDVDTALFVVTGIFKDIPGNSHLRFDVMGSMTSKQSLNSNKWIGGDGVYTYIVLNEGSKASALEQKMQVLVRKYLGPEIEFYTGLSMNEWLGAGGKAGFSLIPVKDIHLYSTSTDELEATGNVTYVYVYAVIGLAILSVAIFNFVNLATARSSARAKEVGIRKVVGSSRTQLIVQFTFESIIVSLIAAFIAIMIVMWLTPSFTALIGKQLAFSIFNRTGLVATLCLAVVVGVVAGIYPAFVLSSHKPVNVLKGIVDHDNPSGLRNLLVAMQFTASIVIIIGTMVVYKQIEFMLSRDLGFDKEQVLVVKDPYGLKEKVESFKNELLKNPSIKGIASSTTIPGKMHEIRSYRKNGESTSFIMRNNQVSYEYKDLMGLEILSGRFFSKESGTDANAVIINEAGARALGFDDPIGKDLTSPWKMGQLITIIGVVKDHNIESMHKSVEPMSLELNPEADYYIAIKLSANQDVRETVDQIHDAWRRNSDNPFQYFFFDEEYENLYRSEVNTGQVLTVFAGLSIFISSLGLIGLIMHIASARKKEIGIRKVLGASLLSVMQLLSSEFFKLVAVATLVSWPIAYLATNYWLTNFTERLPTNLWIYIGATLTVAMVGSIAISFQTIKASTSNPVDSLKSE